MMMLQQFLSFIHVISYTIVMLANRLFELQPRTKEVFGFDINYQPSSSDIGRQGILIHAIRMFHMFDAAFNMVRTFF
jgi:hypothetical protein